MRVCVCVCVCEKEKEKIREGERERERGGGGGNDRVKKTKTERQIVKGIRYLTHFRDFSGCMVLYFFFYRFKRVIFPKAI